MLNKAKKSLPIVYAIIFFSMLLILIPGTTVSAEENLLLNSPEEFERRTEEYIYSNDENYYFDLDLAIQNGENQDMIEFGTIFNAINDNNSEETSVYISDPNQFVTLGLRDDIRKLGSYGNWCGPGNKGKQAVIDVLDLACARHDVCYAQRGWGNRACNRIFVNDIDKIRNSTQWRNLGRATQLYALAARGIFSRYM